MDCRHSAIGTHNCLTDHSEDTGVRCSGRCSQGGIRLLGGTATEGRVEVCNRNVWGTVCKDSWGNTEAMVACEQLGLPSAGKSACVCCMQEVSGR